jgi:hypothetical protein
MINPSDQGHGLDEGAPGLALPGEHATALSCQTVEAAPPLACLLYPAPLQPAAFLEPVQQRIKRGDVNFNRPPERVSISLLIS